MPSLSQQTTGVSAGSSWAGYQIPDCGSRARAGHATDVGAAQSASSFVRVGAGGLAMPSIIIFVLARSSALQPRPSTTRDTQQHLVRDATFAEHHCSRVAISVLPSHSRKGQQQHHAVTSTAHGCASVWELTFGARLAAAIGRRPNARGAQHPALRQHETVSAAFADQTSVAPASQHVSVRALCLPLRHAVAKPVTLRGYRRY